VISGRNTGDNFRNVGKRRLRANKVVVAEEKMAGQIYCAESHERGGGGGGSDEPALVHKLYTTERGVGGARLSRDWSLRGCKAGGTREARGWWVKVKGGKKIKNKRKK